VNDSRAVADSLVTGHASDGMPGLLWAFRVDAGGQATKLSLNCVPDAAAARPDSWLWLHVDLVGDHAQAWLRQMPGLSLKGLESFLAVDHQRKLDGGDGEAYGAVPDFHVEQAGGHDETGHLHFFVTDRLVLTGRRHALRSTQHMYQSVAAGRRLASPAALLEAILEQVVHGYAVIEERASSSLDSVEERILLGRIDDIGDCSAVVGEARRLAVRTHRQVAGLRSLFHHFERQSAGDSGGAAHVLAVRIGHRFDDLDHQIIAVEGRARLLQEEIAAAQTAITNRHLHMLTILTTLLLPVSVITGYFGMNTKNLWLTDLENGSFWSTLICILAPLGTYALMRWRGVIPPLRPRRR
jgi:zinc transporter